MKKTVHLTEEVGGKTGTITVGLRTANVLIEKGLATEVKAQKPEKVKPEAPAKNKAEKPAKNK